MSYTLKLAALFIYTGGATYNEISLQLGIGLRTVFNSAHHVSAHFAQLVGALDMIAPFRAGTAQATVIVKARAAIFALTIGASLSSSVNADAPCLCTSSSGIFVKFSALSAVDILLCSIIGAPGGSCARELHFEAYYAASWCVR